MGDHGWERAGLRVEILVRGFREQEFGFPYRGYIPRGRALQEPCRTALREITAKLMRALGNKGLELGVGKSREIGSVFNVTRVSTHICHAVK